MVKINKKCAECGESKTKKARGREIYLCDVCMEMDKYKLICKTEVKNKYFITEDELEGYDSYTVKQGRGFPDMTLYKVSDVKDIFCANYNIDRNSEDDITRVMNELQAQKEKKLLERREKIRKNKQNARDKRRKKLVSELKKYGLVLRNDSKLCTGFIDGTITDWTVEEITERMCQMKYLYDYCNMNECYQEAYEEQQEEFNAGYIPDCTVFEQAELIALDRYGNYPTIWPWLNN